MTCLRESRLHARATAPPDVRSSAFLSPEPAWLFRLQLLALCGLAAMGPPAATLAVLLERCAASCPCPVVVTHTAPGWRVLTLARARRPGFWVLAPRPPASRVQSVGRHFRAARRRCLRWLCTARYRRAPSLAWPRRCSTRCVRAACHACRSAVQGPARRLGRSSSSATPAFGGAAWLRLRACGITKATTVDALRMVMPPQGRRRRGHRNPAPTGLARAVATRRCQAAIPALGGAA